MVVVVVWVRISSLLISFLAHFFPKSTQNLYCIDSSQQLRFESFCYYSCLLHPSPLNSLRYFWEHAEKWIFFISTGSGRGFGTQGHFNPAFIQGSGTTNSGGGGQ